MMRETARFDDAGGEKAKDLLLTQKMSGLDERGLNASTFDACQALTGEVGRLAQLWPVSAFLYVSPARKIAVSNAFLPSTKKEGD